MNVGLQINLKKAKKMKLLEALKVGNKTLKNSMVMAPMTRSRANFDGIVGDSTILYYT